MENKKEFKGIDISEFNGKIDFEKVKSEVDFIMIRATYGRKGIDKRFKENVKGCIENDIPFGFYYYSYAVDVETAKEECSFFLKEINEYKDIIKYPIAIDMEDSDGYKEKHNALNKNTITSILKVAIEKMQTAGYISMIYANFDFFKNYIDEKEVDKIPKWLAFWNDNFKIDKEKYQIWQKSSKGKISGIEGNVDINISYVDYEKYIAYIRNIIKIQFIKLQSGIEDLTIQYISCFKEGQRLLDKIYNRINNPKKIDNEKEDIHIVVNLEYGLLPCDIAHINNYLYSEQLYLKLYRVLCKGDGK